MMRVKFLTSYADTIGGFDANQIVDLPDDVAKRILAMVRGDRGHEEPIAMVVEAQVCPKCGTRLEEPTTGLEAATVNHAPRRRG